MDSRLFVWTVAGASVAIAAFAGRPAFASQESCLYDVKELRQSIDSRQAAMLPEDVEHYRQQLEILETQCVVSNPSAAETQLSLLRKDIEREPSMRGAAR